MELGTQFWFELLLISPPTVTLVNFGFVCTHTRACCVCVVGRNHLSAQSTSRRQPSPFHLPLFAVLELSRPSWRRTRRSLSPVGCSPPPVPPVHCQGGPPQQPAAAPPLLADDLQGHIRLQFPGLRLTVAHCHLSARPHDVVTACFFFSFFFFFLLAPSLSTSRFSSSSAHTHTHHSLLNIVLGRWGTLVPAPEGLVVTGAWVDSRLLGPWSQPASREPAPPAGSAW